MDGNPSSRDILLDPTSRVSSQGIRQSCLQGRVFFSDFNSLPIFFYFFFVFDLLQSCLMLEKKMYALILSFLLLSCDLSLESFLSLDVCLCPLFTAFDVGVSSLPQITFFLLLVRDLKRESACDFLCVLSDFCRSIERSSKRSSLQLKDLKEKSYW